MLAFLLENKCDRFGEKRIQRVQCTERGYFDVVVGVASEFKIAFIVDTQRNCCEKSHVHRCERCDITPKFERYLFSIRFECSFGSL